MGLVREKDIYLIEPCSGLEEKIILETKNKNKIIIKNWNDGIIANIISTGLCDGKTTMVIAEKTLTEKIVNKLKVVNNKILNYNDNNSLIIKDIPESENYGASLKSRLDVLSRDIDRKINYIHEIYNLFNRKRECGLSLLEIYEKTNKKITQYDEKYDHYMKYKEKRVFQSYKYKELKELVDRIKDKNIVDKYIKYRRFSNNKMFFKLEEEIDIKSINIAIYKISSLLNNEWAFILPMNNNKYNKEFMEEFIHNINISDEDLYKLAEKVYDKQNPEKNRNCYIKTLLNKFLKFDSKESLNRQSEIIDIYKEYIDNKENLYIFINAFNFIKKIVKEEEYDIFIKKLLSEDEVIDYLISLQNAINIYENFKEVTSDILKLSDEEIKILDYCYDNVEKKDEMNSVLLFLPEIYLMVYLNDIEESEKTSINNYKEFEYIRDEILVAAKTKESFIYKYIDTYWSEYSFDISKEGFADDKEEIDFDIIRGCYPCVFIEEENEDLYDMLGNYSPENLIVLSKERALIFNYLYNDTAEEYILKDEGNEEEIETIAYTEMQKDICDIIIKMGYECLKNISIGNFNIDILAISKKDKEVCIAFEIDKKVYGKDNFDVRNDDIYKKYILEKNNISLIRIWSRDWWNERREEIYKIKYILKN